MNLTDHELIFLGLIALAAFVGARLGSRGKSDTAGIARLEQKINSIQSHLGLISYGTQAVNTPVAATGSHFSTSVSADFIDLIRRGMKIEAIKLYRELNPGSDLLTAKNAVEQIERTGM